MTLSSEQLAWAQKRLGDAGLAGDLRYQDYRALNDNTGDDRFDAVVRGMTDHRSNAFVEAMNGLLQQAKRAARGFRTASNFIAIAYLRMSKLTHLPAHPFSPVPAK